MPAPDDDDRPKKKITHEIGQDLTLLSAPELSERIAFLKEEIARLEADKVRKQAQRSTADQASRPSDMIQRAARRCCSSSENQSAATSSSLSPRPMAGGKPAPTVTDAPSP